MHGADPHFGERWDTFLVLFPRSYCFVITATKSRSRLIMKKMLNIFSRSDETRMRQAAVPGFREPTLYANGPAVPSRPAPAARQMPPRQEASAPRQDSFDIPTDYAGIVVFFQKTVSDRKSPFNSLVQAAERLKDFIPDEVGRLKAAYILCGEKWSPEVLALAIQNHIADIDNVCAKAKSCKSVHANDRARQLRAESDSLRQKNTALQAEIDQLTARLADLQARSNADQAKISALDQQARLIEGDAHSVAFLEQAAENLKKDLLAKKSLLGLTM